MFWKHQGVTLDNLLAFNESVELSELFLHSFGHRPPNFQGDHPAAVAVVGVDSLRCLASLEPHGSSNRKCRYAGDRLQVILCTSEGTQNSKNQSDYQHRSDRQNFFNVFHNSSFHLRLAK